MVDNRPASPAHISGAACTPEHDADRRPSLRAPRWTAGLRRGLAPADTPIRVGMLAPRVSGDEASTNAAWHARCDKGER